MPPRVDQPLTSPPAPGLGEVDIRLVQTQEEYGACEELSREVWGAPERNIVPRELLLTIQLNGGLVHGAFLPRGRLIGCCFGFAGLRDGRLRLCSHQLAVDPAFRGSGIGIALKQAQGRDALRLGYELVAWTFDPLEARNAYINLHRLGCIARVYDRNHYGTMEDDLNRGLPTDRFEAEWWLTRNKPTLSVDSADILLRVGPNHEPQLGSPHLDGSRPAIIQIPTDFQAIKRVGLDLALRWRLASRDAFEAALSAGLVAIDFQRQGAYLMARLP